MVRGEAKPRVPLLRRLADMLLGRGVTLGLAIGALVMGIATFVLLSEGSPLGPTRPGQVVGIVLVNLAVILLLLASLAGRLVRVWVERRRGAAGSRLHVRLVLLFSVVAVVPAMLMATFAAIFFNLGIQAWFSDRVRTALEASLVASRAYLEEHQNNIRADALAMANDLNRATVLLPEQPLAFARVVGTQAGIRGLTEAVVFEPILGRVVAHAGMSANFILDPPPGWATELARNGDVAVIAGEDEGRVRAVVGLSTPSGLLLMIGRPVDASVLEHMQRTEAAVSAYHQLDRNREGLQVTFVLIFAIGALLVLLAAVLIGLVLANQLAGQRSELLEAYRQIEERQDFVEAVLGGVSAGVVGLDGDLRVNLPNRSASQLLGVELMQEIGRPMAEIAPEFAALLAQPGATRTAEIRVGPPSNRRTLLARLSPELEGAGYVLTFDDISALLTAQRQAAWADVARRIAHEIKNPLTPIQLSAERLKKRYLKQIHDDPETFTACTDTIVRQVGDIGRMVDEFSAFARMPQPVIRPEEMGRLVREALVLQQHSRPEIAWATALPDHPVHASCDRRLINQALTNLLHNAAEGIAMREASEDGTPRPQGHIGVSLELAGELLCIAVEDDGVGLPDGDDRDRLTEPYVTHKAKGTGLGLAIVKKIMEDHGGELTLDDQPSGPGAVVTLSLPGLPEAPQARAFSA